MGGLGRSPQWGKQLGAAGSGSGSSLSMRGGATAARWPAGMAQVCCAGTSGGSAPAPEPDSCAGPCEWETAINGMRGGLLLGLQAAC